jgi:hypothetical protein
VCDLGGPTERVHLVGVSISFEKNFYRLPFTPPSLVANWSFKPPPEEVPPPTPTEVKPPPPEEVKPPRRKVA